MKTDNTMPIHGCIPNQLQALHDECGALRAENERLRALLRDGYELMRPWHGTSDCECAVCRWRGEVEKLEAATNG